MSTYYIVLRNSAGCELDRVSFKEAGDVNEALRSWLLETSVEPGDTIIIEEV